MILFFLTDGRQTLQVFFNLQQIRMLRQSVQSSQLNNWMFWSSQAAFVSDDYILSWHKFIDIRFRRKSNKEQRIKTSK